MSTYILNEKSLHQIQIIYSIYVPLFLHIFTEHTDVFVWSWHSCSRYQVRVSNHSQTTTSTTSVMRNWRAPKCCLNCPNWVEGLEVSSEMNATTLVSDVCCVGMHCHAEGSYLLRDHMFTPLKCHLGGWQFHSNKELEVTFYEQPLMQEPELYHYRTFKLIHTWDKFIDALENYVKNNYNSWICE